MALGAMATDVAFQYAHYTKTASVEDVGGATDIAISWDTEVNEDAIFTHDNATNNSRVTVSLTGPYQVKATVTLDNTEANKIFACSCFVRVDGTTAKKTGIARGSSQDGGSDQNFFTLTLHTEVDLVASSYIEIMVDQEFEDAAGNPVVNSVNGECELIIRCI